MEGLEGQVSSSRSRVDIYLPMGYDLKARAMTVASYYDCLKQLLASAMTGNENRLSAITWLCPSNYDWLLAMPPSICL